jgi:hypothetical protein
MSRGDFELLVDICTSIAPEMCEPTRYLRGMVSDYVAARRHR